MGILVLRCALGRKALSYLLCVCVEVLGPFLAPVVSILMQEWIFLQTKMVTLNKKCAVITSQLCIRQFISSYMYAYSATHVHIHVHMCADMYSCTVYSLCFISITIHVLSILHIPFS